MSSLIGLTGFILLFAFGVIVLRWLQRRVSQPSGAQDDAIRIIRRVPLDSHTMLIVIQIGGQQYALTSSRHNGTQVVDRLDAPLSEKQPTFQGVLASVLGQMKPKP